jgi:uncharacterized protein
MAYLPESSIITTKDGLQCQVYASVHPKGYVIVKPKYIPTDKINSPALNFRYIHGRKVNRLDMWIDAKKLKKYIEDFKKAYPNYIYQSPNHKTWFFAIPLNKIEKVYNAREGLAELMKMPTKSLDPHLKNVTEFVRFVLKSGLKLKNLGVTYSTLVGHYYLGVSDINLVVYGKNNFWKLMKFMEKAHNPKLRWKTDNEWLNRHKKRNRPLILSKKEFIFHSKRKKFEGFFNNNFFLIHGVEEPYETWFKWDNQEFEPLGIYRITGKIKSDFNSGVRPGFYELENSRIISFPDKNAVVSQIVFHSRNFVLQVKKGELIEAKGLLEKVKPRKGGVFYRLVLGYPEAHLSSRQNKEYIKTLREQNRLSR